MMHVLKTSYFSIFSLTFLYLFAIQVEAAPVTLNVIECTEKANSDGTTTRNCCMHKETQDNGKLISATKSQCSTSTCKTEGGVTTCVASGIPRILEGTVPHTLNKPPAEILK